MGDLRVTELVKALNESRGAVRCTVGSAYSDVRRQCQADSVGRYAVKGAPASTSHLCQKHADYYAAYRWQRVACPCHKEA